MSEKQKIPMDRKHKILASIVALSVLGALVLLFSRGEWVNNLRSAVIIENAEIINVGGSAPTGTLLNTPDFKTGGVSISATGTKGFARQFTISKQTTLTEAQFYAYGNITVPNADRTDGGWPMWLTVVVYKDNNATVDSMPDKSATGEVCVMTRVPYMLFAGVHAWEQLDLTSYNCTLEAGTYWIAFENRSPIPTLSNDNDMTSGTLLLQAPLVSPVVWRNAKISATNVTGLYETDGSRGRFMRLSGTSTTITSRTLTLNKTGNGIGIITSDPAGIECTSTVCTKTYTDNTGNVLLIATPDINSTVTWTGCDVTTGNRCTINMGDGDKGVTAMFALTNLDDMTSTAVFQNKPLSTPTDTPFQVSMKITPYETGNQIDAITALTNGSVSNGSWNDLTATLRFRNGKVDACNGANGSMCTGGVYTSVDTVNYISGQMYPVSIKVYPSTRTYSVYITLPDGQIKTIADNYGFRGAPTNLNNLTYVASIGSHLIQNIAISDIATPPGRVCRDWN